MRQWRRDDHLQTPIAVEGFQSDAGGLEHVGGFHSARPARTPRPHGQGAGSRDALSGRHRARALIARIPRDQSRGKVPALDADGLALCHSVASLARLDRRYPLKPLFGETAEGAAAI